VTVSGSEVEADILKQKVSLCIACNSSLTTPKGRKKMGKKKSKGQWDSEDEDESDGPLYPAGIMKVGSTSAMTRNSDEPLV